MDKMNKKRRQLFQIALQTCVCLMMNLATTVGISAALDEWGQSSNLSLECSLYDSWRTRDWDAYGFTDGQTICREGVSYHGAGTSPNFTECISDCFYSETELYNGIKVYCDLRDGEYLHVHGGYQYLGCECSCDDMVDVQKPSMVVMALSFMAQSLVVSIVGINLGLSKGNLNLWLMVLKPFFQKQFGKSTTIRIRPQDGGTSAHLHAPSSALVVGSMAHSSLYEDGEDDLEVRDSAPTRSTLPRNISVLKKMRMAPEHVVVWNVIAQHKHLLQQSMDGTELESTPENKADVMTLGEMASKVPQEMTGWLMRYIDNIEQRQMPKAAALKAIENAVVVSKFPPTDIIVPQVVMFFIAVMRSLLVPGDGGKPGKFPQVTALYCLFRLRRMEMKGGRYGGLENGGACVDLWMHRMFRLQVVSLLMECIEPVEQKFQNKFAQLEKEDPDNFHKLQLLTSFNSSVGAPLTQRTLVENGGVLSWWMSLVKEVDNFSETMKINPEHKGFKLMVAKAKKLKLKFEDVYGSKADSPDGTWKGITNAHTYEFVFLCFMNAYAKKIVDPIFQEKMKNMFPDCGVCHPGPVKTTQRCNEKKYSLPRLAEAGPLAFLKLPKSAGLLDQCRVTLTFNSLETLLKAYDVIMADPDLFVTNGGRVKNGFLKSFVAPGGYRDLKINPIMNGTGMVCEIQLSLKGFMVIKMESHPYYAQWRVMSEWCTENSVGLRGEITLQNAIDAHNISKSKVDLTECD